MKRIISIFLSIIILSLITINSFAFKIDGNSKRTEWERADTILLLDKKESNNKVNFGLVHWVIEDGSLFLCFSFIEEKPSEDTSMTGISLIIEDSEEFIVTAETSPAQSDSLEYFFEGFSTYDRTNGGTCEIRVGAKYGLPSEISAKARFIDSNGSYSNVYEFTIINKTYTYYEPDYYFEPVVTTTQNTTLKPTTETSSKAEKTTKKSSSKTTKKNSSGLLKKLFNDEEETTAKQTKSAKSTKASSEKTKKQTVKSQKTTNVNNTIENSVLIPTSIVYITESNVAPVNNSISTTEGTKYKLLTALFGGITLVSVAVLGTIGANKKAQKKNNKDE